MYHLEAAGGGLSTHDYVSSRLIGSCCPIFVASTFVKLSLRKKKTGNILLPSLYLFFPAILHSLLKENSTRVEQYSSAVGTRLGMYDSAGLLLDRPDDLRVAMTHVGHADPGGEVQQPRTFARSHIAALAVNYCLLLFVVESGVTC